MPEPGKPSVPSWSVAGSYTPPPYPYPYPPYPGVGAPPAGPRNGLGVASLVVAIGGLVTALSVVGGVLLGIVAVVLGFVGHARVRRGQADNGGVAIAGIVLGALAVVAGLGCVFIYVGIWRTAGGDDYVACMTKAGSNPTQQERCTNRLRENFDKFGSGEVPGERSVQESNSVGLPA